MNEETKNIALISTVVFSWVGISIMALYIRWIANRLAEWIKYHKKVKEFLNSFTYIICSLFIILRSLFITSIVVYFVLYFVGVVYNHIKDYKTEHQKRIEFLENNCFKIDIGYEILNDGKSTYKCPNGKEYIE